MFSPGFSVICLSTQVILYGVTLGIKGNLWLLHNLNHWNMCRFRSSLSEWHKYAAYIAVYVYWWLLIRPWCYKDTVECSDRHKFPSGCHENEKYIGRGVFICKCWQSLLNPLRLQTPILHLQASTISFLNGRNFFPFLCYLLLFFPGNLNQKITVCEYCYLLLWQQRCHGRPCQWRMGRFRSLKIVRPQLINWLPYHPAFC